MHLSVLKVVRCRTAVATSPDPIARLSAQQPFIGYCSCNVFLADQKSFGLRSGPKRPKEAWYFWQTMPCSKMKNASLPSFSLRLHEEEEDYMIVPTI